MAYRAGLEGKPACPRAQAHPRAVQAGHAAALSSGTKKGRHQCRPCCLPHPAPWRRPACRCSIRVFRMLKGGGRPRGHPGCRLPACLGSRKCLSMRLSQTARLQAAAFVRIAVTQVCRSRTPADRTTAPQGRCSGSCPCVADQAASASGVVNRLIEPRADAIAAAFGSSPMERPSARMKLTSVTPMKPNIERR